MRRVAIALLASCGALLLGCGEDEGTGGGGTFSVSGYSQKGPFSNGSVVTVNELDDTFVATGRVFNTEIADDTGSFSLGGVQLASNYARLSVDGFYFDEVAGAVSSARLQLHALADLSSSSTVNVNIISHLERPRVEYLMSQGSDFIAAKAQAQAEVLGIFEANNTSIGASETLDIAAGGDGGAILMALSAIVQGTRTPGEVSELLSAMSTDIRQDGVLDSDLTGASLVNEAVLLDLPAVRTNIETRYATLGVSATIGDFESVVANFISQTSFPFTAGIVYPPTGEFGDNILDPAVVSFDGGSLAATLPRGASVRIVVRMTSGGDPWSIDAFNHGGWDGTDYDLGQDQQEFSAAAVDAELTADMIIMGFGAISAEVSYYENGAANPTAQKQIN